MSSRHAAWCFAVGALLSVLCPILVLAQPVARATTIGAALGVVATVALTIAFVVYLRSERDEHDGADSRSGA